MGAGRGRRTGIILIALILVVILVAAGGLLLLRSLGGGIGEVVVGEEPGGEQETTFLPPTAPPTLDIIIAARDIPRGKQLELDDVTVLSWPLLQEAQPPLGVLTVSEGQGAGLDQVVGRIARVDILNGTPVLENMITPGDQPIDLGDVGSDAALLVPPGKVAIALPITRLSSVAYALREGDHVDVLMSFRFIDVDEEFQTPLPNDIILLTDNPEMAALGFQGLRYPQGREERGLFGTTVLVVPGEGNQGQPVVRQTTQLVIDNAIVMRVGNWPISDINQPIVVTMAPTPTPSEGEGGVAEEGAAEPTPLPAIPLPDIVTLAMSRQDALVLKYATELGVKVDLVLRSAVDDDIEDIVTDPVTLSYIINSRTVTPPEKLPVALDPRVDILNTFSEPGTGEETASEGAGQ